MNITKIKKVTAAAIENSNDIFKQYSDIVEQELDFIESFEIKDEYSKDVLSDYVYNCSTKYFKEYSNHYFEHDLEKSSKLFEIAKAFEYIYEEINAVELQETKW